MAKATRTKATPLPPNTLPGAWTKTYEAHALQVGLFLLEWNDLQETFADLFTTILGLPDGSIARSIWYSVTNDRMQRKILLESALRVFDPAHTKSDGERSVNLALMEEIKWLVESANNLGPRRDAAAHSPVALVIDEPLRVIARHRHGHPLAKSLKDKELLTEFRLNAHRALMLHQHAVQIDQYLRYERQWIFPTRPDWPVSPQKKNSSDATRKASAKRTARQQPPTQE